MKVVNIEVKQLDVFEDILICKLIKEEISYVKIDHEFHFLDRIYRFYELGDNQLDDINTIDNLGVNILLEMPRQNCFYTYEEESIYTVEEKQKQNKSMIKHMNKIVNKDIKRLSIR